MSIRITNTAAVAYALLSDTPSVAKTYKWSGSGLPGSNIDIGIDSDDPTQYMTAAASESALVIPSITPVAIPGIAAGSTTFVIVCHLVAPNPRLPSLYELGIEDIVTSATWNMVGIAMIANTSPPESIDHPSCRNTTKNDNPKRPYMIDGIDASVSAPNRTAFTIGPSFAYSAKYIAAPTPNGVAMSPAINVTYKLEIIIGNIPPDSPESIGDDNRNSKFTCGNPCNRM